MKDESARVDSLNQWVSSFLRKHTRDLDSSEYKVITSKIGSYCYWEIRTKPVSVFNDGVIPVDTDTRRMLEVARSHMKKWEIPASLYGTLIMLLACTDPRDVQMMVAVAHWRHQQIIQKDPSMKGDGTMDTFSVCAVFQNGLPTKSHLDAMWKAQILEPGQFGGMTHHNMLDYLTATDFLLPKPDYHFD